MHYAQNVVMHKKESQPVESVLCTFVYLFICQSTIKQCLGNNKNQQGNKACLPMR